MAGHISSKKWMWSGLFKKLKWSRLNITVSFKRSTVDKA